MNKYLSEQDVLNRLGIESFRQLSKDKVMVLANMWEEIQPEIAMKAVEQFPNFSDTMREVYEGFNGTVKEGLQSGDKSVESYYKSCDEIISAALHLLENDSLTFEEKRFLLERAYTVMQCKGEKDTEQKKFITALVGISLLAASVTAGVLFTALGGKIKIERK